MPLIIVNLTPLKQRSEQDWLLFHDQAKPRDFGVGVKWNNWVFLICWLLYDDMCVCVCVSLYFSATSKFLNLVNGSLFVFGPNCFFRNIEVPCDPLRIPLPWDPHAKSWRIPRWPHGGQMDERVFCGWYLQHLGILEFLYGPIRVLKLGPVDPNSNRLLIYLCLFLWVIFFNGFYVNHHHVPDG